MRSLIIGRPIRWHGGSSLSTTLTAGLLAQQQVSSNIVVLVEQMPGDNFAMWVCTFLPVPDLLFWMGGFRDLKR